MLPKRHWSVKALVSALLTDWKEEIVGGPGGPDNSVRRGWLANRSPPSHQPDVTQHTTAPLELCGSLELLELA